MEDKLPNVRDWSEQLVPITKYANVCLVSTHFVSSIFKTQTIFLYKFDDKTLIN